ncbi:prenylated flavin chaperone LpdD [Bombilactobacillus thymidiniphilus]|uniref:Amino acid decarboxylase n=1 Tax=Bombilactobacillus thymidiniphilus TaxID=2923363 RepID=A0ABY4PEL3_9LACO|nr:amino acid decarboxylase [Bombilactobacillus thymidiniphilus]UQS84070.1 amino acid decarboxylase [Bombilactobacillus thymidiniphilus]
MANKYTSVITQLDFSLRIQAEFIGKDLLVSITGGDHPHIGAITTIDQTSKTSDQAFPSHDGRVHKDDTLSRQIIQIIKSSVPGVCVVLAGVHVDHISKEQLKATGPMTVELSQRLKKWLDNTTVTITDPQYYGKSEQPE